MLIDGKEYMSIFQFSMFYSGWESDTHGFIVEDGKGNRFVAMSSCENFHIVKDQKLNLEIGKLRKALKDLHKARHILHGDIKGE